MARNRFTNPATGAFYDWHKNHSEEQEAGKTRNITHTAPTTNGVGLIRQQGADDPYVLRYTGEITDRAQYRAMWSWFRLTGTQTVYFTDFDGQAYEVQITHFETARHRRLMRPGLDPGQHYWTYSIEMEVYRFLSGDLQVVGVTP